MPTHQHGGGLGDRREDQEVSNRKEGAFRAGYLVSWTRDWQKPPVVLACSKVTLPSPEYTGSPPERAVRKHPHSARTCVL